MRLIESLGNELPMAQNWVVATLTVDFLDVTFYGTDVTLTATEVSAGNSSLTIRCEMVQDRRLTVRGRVVLVYLDPESNQPCRIPDAMRERIARL